VKYLCLGYYEPEKFEALSETEVAAIADECRPHDQALYRTGRVALVASLDGVASKIVKRRRNRKEVVDGPYTETKEVIGSFFIVEADSFDEAVEIAGLHPAANWGEHMGWAIEVRPIGYYAEQPG
jgi:hypothetical protein